MRLAGSAFRPPPVTHHFRTTNVMRPVVRATLALTRTLPRCGATVHSPGPQWTRCFGLETVTPLGASTASSASQRPAPPVHRIVQSSVNATARRVAWTARAAVETDEHAHVARPRSPSFETKPSASPRIPGNDSSVATPATNRESPSNADPQASVPSGSAVVDAISGPGRTMTASPVGVADPANDSNESTAAASASIAPDGARCTSTSWSVYRCPAPGGGTNGVMEVGANEVAS